jgi:adenylyl-sulfate kinase
LSLVIPFENWFGEAPFCICIERVISSHVSRWAGRFEPFPPEPCRHSFSKKSSPAKKESMRAAGRRANLMYTGLKIDMKKENHSGAVVFFTGLSGAGKSTIAQILSRLLSERQDRSVSILDGDVVRQHLSNELGFSREDRNTNIRRIGFVAGEIAKHGGIALCATIAPYAESRDDNRILIERRQGTYLEVFVKTPLAVCEERDVKGHYKKVRAGVLNNFTGIDDPYEEPKSADLVIETTKMLPEEAAEEVYRMLMNHGVISIQA